MDGFCRVRLVFGPRLGLFDAAKTLAGLCGLAAERAIELEVVRGDGGSDGLRFDVTAGGPWRKVAIDLSDHHGRFLTRGLEACDVYFKRSFAADETAKLPAEQRAKGVPFGLTVPCPNAAARGLAIRQALRRVVRRPWALKDAAR